MVGKSCVLPFLLVFDRHEIPFVLRHCELPYLVNELAIVVDSSINYELFWFGCVNCAMVAARHYGNATVVKRLPCLVIHVEVDNVI